MIDDIYLIIVSRLKEYITFPFNWDGVLLNEIDVRELINEVDVVSEYYPDLIMYKKTDRKYSKEWHIGRIKYFVENPDKISPISIDNDCSSGFISGFPIITDGHHRLMAAFIRNDKTIPATYSGIVETLKYLTGEINDKFV